ncbi:MAG: hypothetical protein ABS43_28330 [Bordetella sp. SCN 67-23]|nr:tripartite tricarboxylate transporter substrate binding protein [Burkholderiales bacterium]ODS68393.1 MAG: hypothetical protein ABS43_28330 [Bordetella sp. SCN 67-23]ODU77039.1 MAG: hypothetical protein ABT00_14505 [Bordetella sp. SCN 68-11]OJW93732.1 MAG: hypothetical protein BGO71_17675 [Burkholderiales bacterium 67-32]
MLHRLAAGAALVLLSPLSQAAPDTAAFPTRAVKIVVGYTPGGGTDMTARLLAQQLGEKLGQSVIVENRPGAGQNIGATYVSRADPDGYTLFLSSSALAINVSLFPKLDYDPIKSFAPIAVFGQSPNLLVVSSKLPVNNVKQLIAYGKEHPGALNFSSSGHGSTQHLSAELFKLRTGISATHVPYKGSGPSINGVQTGEVQFTFINIPSMSALMGSDKVKVIGLTSSKRSAAVPDVPTLAESGVEGMDVAAWYGLLAPAGTPPAIVKRLNQAVNDALADEKFRTQLIQAGVEPMNSTPEFFASFLADDIALWKKVISAAGTKVD